MEAFGDVLRGERERRGMTVESVCSVTKVSYRHVESLEAGRYAELPGGVFRKGIVRSYLAALGLEEETWMHRFEDALRARGMSLDVESDFSEFAKNVKRSRGGFRQSVGWRWLGVVGFLIFLGILGWAAWKYVIQPKVRRGEQVTLSRSWNQTQQ